MVKYIEFRDLNKACPKDEFSLPNIDMLVDAIVGHSMCSFLDDFSSYNHIKLHPLYAEKIAFRTPMGNFFHYTVMPFGLNEHDCYCLAWSPRRLY